MSTQSPSAESSPLRVAIDEVTEIPDPWLRIERFSLRVSAVHGPDRVIQRVICGRGDRVAVLPYCRSQRSVLLVRVFRMPALLDALPSATLLEAPGGLIGDELPELAASREALEETNCEVRALASVGSVYLSPQLSAERTHLFLGEYRQSPAGRAAIPDSEGELATVLELGLEDALTGCHGPEVVDGKTWLLLNAAAQRWA